MEEPVDEEEMGLTGLGCCAFVLVGGIAFGYFAAVVDEQLLLDGTGSWEKAPTFPGFVWVMALPGFFLSLLCMSSSYMRRGAIVFALLTFGLLVGIWNGAGPAARIKRTAFEEAIVRMEPLVKAAHRFEDEKGHPPTSLRVLIPEYLERMPKQIPVVKLIQGPTVEGSAWSFEAPVTRGMLNQDTLLYLPNQNYDASHCTYYYMIGDWAFLKRKF